MEGGLKVKEDDRREERIDSTAVFISLRQCNVISCYNIIRELQWSMVDMRRQYHAP